MYDLCMQVNFGAIASRFSKEVKELVSLLLCPALFGCFSYSGKYYYGQASVFKLVNSLYFVEQYSFFM